MSNRELAAWYSISEGAIRKRAKKENWEKLGTQQALRTIPEVISIERTPVTPETTSPEAIVGRGRNLTLRLLDELDATRSRLGELEMIIDSSVDGEDAEKQREALRQAISLKQWAEVAEISGAGRQDAERVLPGAALGGMAAGLPGAVVGGLGMSGLGMAKAYSDQSNQPARVAVSGGAIDPAATARVADLAALKERKRILSVSIKDQERMNASIAGGVTPLQQHTLALDKLELAYRENKLQMRACKTRRSASPMPRKHTRAHRHRSMRSSSHSSSRPASAASARRSPCRSPHRPRKSGGRHDCDKRHLPAAA